MIDPRWTNYLRTERPTMVLARAFTPLYAYEDTLPSARHLELSWKLFALNVLHEGFSIASTSDLAIASNSLCVVLPLYTSPYSSHSRRNCWVITSAIRHMDAAALKEATDACEGIVPKIDPAIPSQAVLELLGDVIVFFYVYTSIIDIFSGSRCGVARSSRCRASSLRTPLAQAQGRHVAPCEGALRPPRPACVTSANTPLSRAPSPWRRTPDGFAVILRRVLRRCQLSAASRWGHPEAARL